MDITDRAYSNIVTMLEGLLDFHPEMTGSVSSSDHALLAKYYFFDCPVEVEDIFVYRVHLLDINPDLQAQAEAALRRFLRANNIKGDPALPGDWL